MSTFGPLAFDENEVGADTSAGKPDTKTQTCAGQGKEIAGKDEG